jgi:tetratricopeptide (TPR) repeat protein
MPPEPGRPASEQTGPLAGPVPHSAPALLAAARQARAAGRHAEAAALARQAIGLAPRNPGAHAELAAALRLAGDAGDAAAAAAEALALDPANPLALSETARLALARGDRDEAYARFEQAAAAQPDNPQALLDLAAAAHHAQDYARARDAAARAAQRAPGSVAAWMALGWAERALGQAGAAQEAFRRAARLRPAAAAPFLALVGLAIDARDPAAARAALDEAPPELRQTAAYSLAEGRLAQLLGRSEQAAACFAEAVAREPANTNARIALVNAAVWAGRLDLAEATLAELAALPGAPEAPLPRAALLRRRGRLREALALLQRSQQGGDRSFAVGLEAARLTLSLHGPEAALNAPVAKSPAEEAALARLRGAAAEAAFDIAAAADHYGRAVALAPADTAALDARARTAVLLLDESGAAAALRRKADAEAALRRARGWAHAPSQSLTGQIALEFRLDRTGSRAIAGVLALPPAERIAPLTRLVAEAPGSTAAALWLLISLRQAGLLEAPPPAECPIPRRLLWTGGRGSEPLRDAWAVAEPSLAVTAFASTREAATFLAERHGDAGVAAWRRAADDVVRAELLRICWLAEGGGWAPAGDTLPVAPLASLGAGGAGFVAGQGLWGAPMPALLGAAPDNPVIRRAAASLVTALARGDREHPWLRCGPGFLARAIAGTLAAEGQNAARVFLLPEHRMNQAIASHCAL